MKLIEKMDDLLQLEDCYKSLMLVNDEPKKGQEFILWRGLNNADYDLMSSLQVYLKKLKPVKWQSEIKDFEKKLINNFLTEIKPYQELQKQYPWFRPQDHINDIVWDLSVMQHYGCPTRFVDFTSCFWTAIFFATEGAQDDIDMALYSLKCKNEDNNDLYGNKLPKDFNGNAWKDNQGRVNINDFLGQIIGCKGFEDKKDFSNWKLPSQSYGWDQPKIKNARVKKQKGFFVYLVDVSQTLEEILPKFKEFEKYIIKGTLLPTIKKELKKKKYDSWVVYLDIERAFKHLMNNLL